MDAGDPNPGNQPCVVVCGPNERDAGGYCEPCPTYQACDGGGNLATQYWCNAGSPPGSAQTVNYQACQSGATVTLQACVDTGGSPPANTPCPTSCTEAGERLVGGVCESCPTYIACAATAGDDRDDLKESRMFCQPGSPPRDALTRWNIACVGGDSEGQWQCFGEDGLPGSDPGDVPCPGESCIYFDGCDRSWAYSRRDVIQAYYLCAFIRFRVPHRRLLPGGLARAGSNLGIHYNDIPLYRRGWVCKPGGRSGR